MMRFKGLNGKACKMMMTHFKLYKKSLQVPLTSLQPLQWYFMEFVFLQVKILHVHSAIGKKVLVVSQKHTNYQMYFPPMPTMFCTRSEIQVILTLKNGGKLMQGFH